MEKDVPVQSVPPDKAFVRDNLVYWSDKAWGTIKTEDRSDHFTNDRAFRKFTDEVDSSLCINHQNSNN